MNLFKGINIFEDRILFIFSDPGGAKPILAFIDDNKLQNYKVISDRVYSFYDDFGVPVHPYKGNVKEEIDIFKPTLIFTGTSYTSTIEKEFISCGKYNHISTLSYVDHWTNISDRFKLQDNF